MSDTLAARLTGEQIIALRFAAHRQLARWSNKPGLSPHQHAQRTALRRAAHVLHDDAFAHGCELHTLAAEDHADA
jgi:hypothetical protein